MTQSTSVLIRVSLRFKAVCEELSKRHQVSSPVATEMILDEFFQGGLIRYGTKIDIKNIIKEVSKKQNDNMPLHIEETPRRKGLKRLPKRKSQQKVIIYQREESISPVTNPPIPPPAL